MAYQSSGIIEASNPSNDDFNELVALLNEVYNDTNSGDFTLTTGTYGYGQTPAIATVSPGDVVTAAQWTALFEAFHDCATHIGNATGNIPTSVSVGDLIEAFDGTGGNSNLQTLINQVRAGRLSVDAGQTTTTAGGGKLTETRNTPWTTSVTHTFQVTFANGNEARYFFNSGGEIRWSGEYTPGASNPDGEETVWQQALSDMGTVIFNWQTTTSDSGTSNPIGYYNLSTTFQEIAQKNVDAGGGTYYSTEAISVSARYTDAQRNILEFQVEFATDPQPDRILDGTLNSYVDQRITSGAITLTDPTYATTVFTGS
jgi:hypothetical protein